MSERQYLKDSILVCSESSGRKYARRFKIRKMLNEGMSVICYEAYYEKSGRGILKEFYPETAISLIRNKDGQLVHSEGFEEAKDRFCREQKEYSDQHEPLLMAKQKSDSDMLASFIPNFEIYYGCDENLNVTGTVYIWTPEPKVVPFSQVSEEVHKEPEESPEYKLFAVLKGIESLTKCLSALHKEGMIHRDIKPSNFGFQKRGEETLTQTLTMFDIDSICSVYTPELKTMGTAGYMEPEAYTRRPSVQTDIYSIGATLFQAVCVNEETKENEYRYDASWYRRLDEFVDSSRLIRASEANSNPKLRSILTAILTKSLARRNKRYTCCEEMLADLEQAMFYVLPAGIARKEQRGETWVLTDARKVLDRNRDKNSALAIKYHLFDTPLYETEEEKEKELNVLMLGLGGYGQKFLDICLQAGQMRNKKLNVTVVSKDAEDLPLYLSERKGLPAFFSFNGKYEGEEEPYGIVTGYTALLDDSSEEALKESTEKILREICGMKHIHYIFAAVGDDRRSQSAAKICHQYYNGVIPHRTSVQFIREGKRLASRLPDDLHAVYVRDDDPDETKYDDLERMAFNAHCIWDDNMNANYRKLKKEFRKPYNHDSSVANVLSLKYKLHSIGIELTEGHYEDAAAQYKADILGNSEKKKKLRNELIWMEHRRWVTERLCTGWTQLKDLEYCLSGDERDREGKRNLCIVRSRPDQMLEETWTHEKWDTAKDSELDELDDLDRLSVLLHRVYARKAKELKKKDLLNSTTLQEIRKTVSDSHKALDAFREWFMCIQDIWNKEEGRVRLYRRLKTRFLECLDELPAEAQKSTESHTEIFDSEFYVFLKAMEYHSWKNNDTRLVDNIPFILTYTEDSCIAVPFCTGNNDEVFNNAAAAALLNPQKLIYLCWLDSKDGIAVFRKDLQSVLNFLNKKSLRSEADILLICKKQLAEAAGEDLKRELKETDRRIGVVKVLPVESSAAAVQNIEDYLNRRRRHRSLFALEKNDSGLSWMLDGAGVYERIPCYTVDAPERSFTPLHGCAPLQYVRKTAFLTVNDITAFRLSGSNSGKHPEFYEDYEELWKIYNAQPGIWKAMCNTLAECEEKNRPFPYFPIRDESRKGETETLRYILPSFCSASASKIVDALVKEGVAEEGSAVSGYTSDACEVLILDRCSNKEQYDRTFSKVYCLTDPAALSAYRTPQKSVQITFNDLTVRNYVVSDREKSKIVTMLESFADRHYLLYFRKNPVDKANPDSDISVSFTYASYQIKELLTTAGKMLEVYVYHRARELGQFDDVAGSYEVYWDGSDVMSEFDCVITKGFRTLFIECKARHDLDQSYYYRLKELKDTFGIHATAVLIADTKEKDSGLNRPHRERGEKMDVVTIYRQNEIEQIGDTLLQILEGTYKG